MFVGHYAVALTAKRAAPSVSLGTLIFAAQFLDLLWPVLLLGNVEHVRIDPGNTPVTPFDFVDYPFSHSLLMVGVWAVLVGALYVFTRRNGRTAMIVGAVVISHWILDYITHRPDLPLMPGGIRVGLGLWYSLPATILVEGAFSVVAVILYVRAFPPVDNVGKWSFLAFAGLLFVAWGAAILGPPPASEQMVAVGALFGWIFVPWGYWIDRHRAGASINS